MRSRVTISMAAVALLGGMVLVQGAQKQHHNPVIGLLEQGKPVFGLYAPSNRRFRGPETVTPPVQLPEKSPLDLAKEAVAFKTSDFVFDGGMEGGVEDALPAFTAFIKGMQQAGAISKSPFLHLTHPFIVKTPELGDDPAAFAADVSTQLNLGVSGLMFPKAESAEQVRKGIAAMRFESQGGTRPDAVGMAPDIWGMSEAEYKKKADVWPLNPDGELINWTIIESKEGLANVREIAAVEGIGVLWPGAGTLRGIFSTRDANGERVLDEAAWEAAIQQVLAACKEFDVPCGFPASPDNIEMRMEQGFSVFVMGWGEPGFKAVEIGRKASGRADSMQ